MTTIPSAGRFKATSGRSCARCIGVLIRLVKRQGMIAALAAAAITAAFGQSAMPVAAVGLQVAQYDAQLRAMAHDAENPRLDDAALRQKAAAIVPIDQALDAIVADLAARTAAIDARLAELGPAPKTGEPPEAAEITQERNRVIASRQAIDTEARQARVLTVATDQLTTRLADRRRELFSAQLWAHSRSVLNPGLWIDFAHNVPADATRLTMLYKAQAKQMVGAAPGPATLIGWLISIAIALLLLFPGGFCCCGLAIAMLRALPPHRGCANRSMPCG